MKWEFIAEAKRILEREQGTIYKDWGGKLAIALAYPNTYQVGMSNLGLQTVYRLFNERADVVCERVFYKQGSESRPLISLESQRDVKDFAVLAFSISFEMDYLNVVEMLRQADIPPLAEERDEDYPLLLAGGPAVTVNPQPLAPIFDAFAIGEGEVIVPPLIETLQSGIGESRDNLLSALANIPGIYVPIQPPTSNIQHPVKRQWAPNLDTHPTTSVVLTPDTEFGDMYLIEIARGCGRGCRFCLAGYSYRPVRERSLAVLLEQAEEGLRYRDRIGLVSAAVSDYSRLEELATGLREMGAKLSVSSLRVDPLPEALVRALAESGVQTLTIAPEAGSQRLRTLINKNVSEDDLMRAAELAARYRFAQLKLYFMLGLPTETDEDVQALIDLVLAVRERFPRRITANITPFVPKAHTPFQWVAMAPVEGLKEGLARIEQALRPGGIAVKAESPAWAAVQGVLSRGDSRVGQALVKVKRRSLAAWRRALRECQLDAAEYLRERSWDEPLPWAVVDSGVSDDYLWREMGRAMKFKRE
ncbi:MAG: radical SAM protein [Anaerolineales bacterium]|nr:radical SAM protein [Anaerolineales bacterium]